MLNVLAEAVRLSPSLDEIKMSSMLIPQKSWRALVWLPNEAKLLEALRSSTTGPVCVIP